MMKLILISLVLLSFNAYAESDPWTVHANFDAYYQYSGQAHRPAASPGAAHLEGRTYDDFHNQVILNMAEVTLEKKTGELAFRLGLGFGPMIDAYTVGGTLHPDTAQPVDAAEEPTRNITQAVVSFTPKEVPHLTVSAGKFFSHVGLESFLAKDNWQYSRSLASNYNPNWHQGVSAAYSLMEGRLTTTILFLNAYDGRISQKSDGSSTIGFSLNSTPAEGVTFNYNYIGGREGEGDGRREVHEANATAALGPKLSVAAEYFIGQQARALRSGERAWWAGWAAYAKYSPRPGFSISTRYEQFDDSNQGFALSGFSADGGVMQTIKSVTLTNAFQMNENLELRIEYRSDSSNSDSYFKRADGSPSRWQDSYTAAALLSF